MRNCSWSTRQAAPAPQLAAWSSALRALPSAVGRGAPRRRRPGGAPPLPCAQNLRGGKVKLQSIMMPEMEFGHPEKGDALYAMELALSLEKLNFQKLRQLHEVAEKHGDSQMCDFVGERCRLPFAIRGPASPPAGQGKGSRRLRAPSVPVADRAPSAWLAPRPALPAEGKLLADQADSVRTVAEYVSQLRRVGQGLGVYQFDLQLGAAQA